MLSIVIFKASQQIESDLVLVCLHAKSAAILKSGNIFGTGQIDELLSGTTDYVRLYIKLCHGYFGRNHEPFYYGLFCPCEETW